MRRSPARANLLLESRSAVDHYANAGDLESASLALPILKRAAAGDW